MRKVDCIEVYSVVNAKVVVLYRPRIYSDYFCGMVELNGAHVLQNTPLAAFNYANQWLQSNI